MFFETIKDIIFNENIVYVSILILMIASFSGAMIASLFKGVEILKNSYYSYLFEKDLWTQSLEINIKNSKSLKDKATMIKMFTEGLKVFMSQHEKTQDYNSGASIDLTTRTMKVILNKDLNYLSQGFNILNFNSSYMPFASITLASWDILNIFNTVDIGVLTLSMFSKAMTVLVLGLALSGISTVIYLTLQNKLEEDEKKALIFIDEFANFLHRNFYNQK